MTTKIKQRVIIGLCCLSAGALCCTSVYDHMNKQIIEANEQIHAAEQMNERLKNDNIALSTTVENKDKQVQELQNINEELVQQIEELESRRSVPEVSRGSVRTTTLEITGYSSGDGMTPSSVMANGEPVHVGAAAMNGVPFGTRIYIPELDRIVIVKDRCGYDGVLDVYCDTIDECYSIGRRVSEVQFID